MAYYFVAQIRINDQAEYEQYLDQIDEVFSLYNGEYLAVDEKPVVLEGHWNYTKSVLIRFNSKQEFEDWYFSEAYQKILRYRLNSSTCDTILIKGLDDTPVVTG